MKGFFVDLLMEIIRYIQSSLPLFSNRQQNQFVLLIEGILDLDELRCTGTHSERYHTARLAQTSHSHSLSFFYPRVSETHDF